MPASAASPRETSPNRIALFFPVSIPSALRLSLEALPIPDHAPREHPGEEHWDFGAAARPPRVTLRLQSAGSYRGALSAIARSSRVLPACGGLAPRSTARARTPAPNHTTQGGLRQGRQLPGCRPDGDTKTAASGARAAALERRPRGTERSRPVSCPRRSLPRPGRAPPPPPPLSRFCP